MIETKEQFGELRAEATQYAVHDRDTRWLDAILTIEALREVAKVAQFAKYMAASSLDRPLNDQLDKLRAALDKIPDWIKEDG